MTENKQFKEIYPNIIRSNYCFTDNGKPIGDKEVCDLLNEQHETITRLEKGNNQLRNGFRTWGNKND